MENKKVDDVLSDGCFDVLVELTHRFTGISIGKSRKFLLEGRLKKRIRELKLAGYQAYIDYLKATPDEKESFIDLVTTNETYFFRTPRIWEYLEKNYIPTWHKNNPKGTFRIWSAAASSGDEAHSLGVLCQAFKDSTPDFQYQILGTDISQEMVALCQKGSYQGRSLEQFQKLKPQWFQKYMKKDGESFQVIPEIKAKIKFQTHNLFQTLAGGQKFDLILLRNVLIYFTREDQAKVLNNVHKALEKQSILIIGESETLSYVESEFERVEPLIYLPRSTVKKGMAA